MAHRVVIIGAGIGGLVAAVDLARQGCTVTVLERADAPGGKMRVIDGVDAGPTVFTMRWVLDSVFQDAGASLADHLTLAPAVILARHAWADGARLDLFADPARSADAIGRFAGAADARGFLSFCADARRTYKTLEAPFIKGVRPTRLSLARDVPLGDLLAIRPFQSLWASIGEHMRDPRLRQLFGRYATYCGSSPFLAPATLMLVADVEQQGVWMVQGGMHRVAATLADLAAAHGAVLRCGAEAASITASCVRLASGERVEADAVILNADPAALAGLLGAPAAPAPLGERSLSALTWTGSAAANGFPLERHNVFFSNDYRAEFDDIARDRLPTEPTVYVCAQDRPREAVGDAPDHAAERLLILVNAPATGDRRAFSPSETDTCTNRTFTLLRRCGLQIDPAGLRTTNPADFHRLFPATGGALYGPAVHGSSAAFRRPSSRTTTPGLYLAGGGTHPGAGVPMAALSGRLAASAVMADLGSTRRSRGTAMSGGMPTR